MVRIEFLGPIAQPSIEMEAESLAQVARALRENAQIKPWLDTSAVAVNDTLVGDLDTPLKDGDKVSLLPPVCGG